MYWRVCTYISFSDTDVRLCEAYGNVVDYVSRAEAGRGIVGIVEDDYDWDLGDVSSYRDAIVCRILRVGFEAIQELCR